MEGLKQRRLERIKNAFKKPYIFSFIFIFLAYIGLNVYVNELHVYTDVLTSYAKWFVVPFLFFNFLLIPGLTALTINLAVLRFKEAGGFGKGAGGAGMSSAGIFGGILGGACPGCFAGLFPAFLGLFGVTATLGNLPLFGLEIQIGAAILLTVAIFLLTQDVVCKIPVKN